MRIRLFIEVGKHVWLHFSVSCLPSHHGDQRSCMVHFYEGFQCFFNAIVSARSQFFSRRSQVVTLFSSSAPEGLRLLRRVTNLQCKQSVQLSPVAWFTARSAPLTTHAVLSLSFTVVGDHHRKSSTRHLLQCSQTCLVIAPLSSTSPTTCLMKSFRAT